jgi:hypothetical protein
VFLGGDRTVATNFRKIRCFLSEKKQWNFQKKSILGAGQRVRFKAHSVPFRLNGIAAGTTAATTSHLCHESRCVNPHHLVVEPLDVNKGRNGCAGPSGGCAHQPPCLMQGPNIVSSSAGHTGTSVHSAIGAELDLALYFPRV